MRPMMDGIDNVMKSLGSKLPSALCEATNGMGMN